MSTKYIFTQEQIEQLKNAFYRSLTKEQKKWDAKKHYRLNFISKQYGRQLGSSYYIAIKGFLRALEGKVVNYFYIKKAHAECLRLLICHFVYEHIGVEISKSKALININEGELRFLSATNLKVSAGFYGDVFIDDANFIGNLNELVLHCMYGISIKKNEQITIVI